MVLATDKVEVQVLSEENPRELFLNELAPSPPESELVAESAVDEWSSQISSITSFGETEIGSFLSSPSR